MASLVDVDTDYKLLLRYSILFCGAHFRAFTVYMARSIRVPPFFFFFSTMDMDPWVTEMILLAHRYGCWNWQCIITTARNYSVMAI